ncbi:hypothetical protein L208DRAFT_1407693 [Tricholoma matsutake]|nr:hypothetical protein L208DRAFT_1407693 [Tricholoma matsutake 945]
MDIDIGTTYGANLIGLILASVLYGVTLLQTFSYYRQYPRDSFFTKGLVFVVWFLDTAQLVLISIDMYWHLVTNYNKPEVLGKTTWSSNLQIDCNGLIGLLVICFFARRVWCLSGNIWITVIIVILAFVHLSLGIVSTVEAFILIDTKMIDAKLLRELIWLFSVGLGSAAAADVIIACALCYYLLKNRTQFERTNSIIMTLIMYSLTTGSITSVIAFLSVVTFVTSPGTNVWQALFWILGKCYVNSLLSSLNSRDSLREQIASRDAILQLSSIPTTSAMTNHKRGNKGLSVHIQTVSKTDYAYPASTDEAI